MKLVFASNSEKNRITEIVNNASSISNSQSLIALVRDAVVDGSEAEPKVKEVVSVPNQEQESMADLIKRATGLGVAVSSEDSRAGILQKIGVLKKSKPASVEEDTEDEEEVEGGAEDAEGEEEAEEEEAPKKPAKRKTRTSKK